MLRGKRWQFFRSSITLFAKRVCGYARHRSRSGSRSWSRGILRDRQRHRPQGWWRDRFRTGRLVLGADHCRRDRCGNILARKIEGHAGVNRLDWGGCRAYGSDRKILTRHIIGDSGINRFWCRIARILRDGFRHNAGRRLARIFWNCQSYRGLAVIRRACSGRSWGRRRSLSVALRLRLGLRIDGIFRDR